MKQWAFYFDASQCSGCKTCQVACKDKHDHPVGMRWRNVYEVAGGQWVQKGKNWISEIKSYNISLACNHCEEPICMTKCPNNAIYKNGEGLVLINEKRCMGCQYCAWACPYDALHLNKNTGKMTKCTMCADYIAEGKLPSCVTACPMRVLKAGELNEYRKIYGWHAETFPLPPARYTKPALVITEHPAASLSLQCEVINREEVKNA